MVLKNVKLFASYTATLKFVSFVLSQTPIFTLRAHGCGASASRGVPVCAFTCCWFSWRDGQAELTWVAGYFMEMIYPSADCHPSKYNPRLALINFID